MLLLVSASLLCYTGCATIMNGTKQEIEIVSSPPGAQVWIDTSDVGVTPLSAKVERGEDHNLRIVLEGYDPVEIGNEHLWSGWIWGNLTTALFVLPVPIQLIVDIANGSAYEMEYDQVYVRLHKEAPQNEETGRKESKTP